MLILRLIWITLNIQIEKALLTFAAALWFSSPKNENISKTVIPPNWFNYNNLRCRLPPASREVTIPEHNVCFNAACPHFPVFNVTCDCRLASGTRGCGRPPRAALVLCTFINTRFNRMVGHHPKVGRRADWSIDWLDCGFVGIRPFF